VTVNLFSIDVTGLEQVQKRLAKLAPALMADVDIAAANYLLDVIVNKEIPPYKHVRRDVAYPETGDGFFSPKQKRWFFWALKHGMIDSPYRRRGKHGGIATRWHIIRHNQDVSLVNDDPAAMYLYDNDRQARQLGMVGWLKIQEILAWRKKNIEGVLLRAANKAIKKANYHG
jgi:hypothetical protein